MSDNADVDFREEYFKLVRATKIGLGILLLGISLFNVLGAVFLVPKFGVIYHRVGNRPSPMTLFLIDNHLSLTFLSIVLPVTGMLICFIAPPKKIARLLGILIVVALSQLVMTLLGLVLSLVFTSPGMSSGNGG